MFDESCPPIRSDDDVLRLARDVIGDDGGGGRTLWVLALDEDDRPLPAVLPMTGAPADPDPEDVERLSGALGTIARGLGAARLILVWERPGGGVTRMQEADWAAALAATDAPIRAQLLATDDGVRLIDPAFEAIVAQ